MQSSFNGKDPHAVESTNRTLRKGSNSQKGGEGASPRRGIKHTCWGYNPFYPVCSISLKITLFLFRLRPNSKDWAGLSKNQGPNFHWNLKQYL